MAAQARLGDYTFQVDPSSVAWDYRVRMAKHSTVGGRVIQVFGTDLGDMVVRGRIVPDGRKGDTEGWEAMERFLDKVDALAEESADSQGRVTHRFTVPSKGWAFDVYIKDVAPVEYTVRTIAPEFLLTLFIVEDVTGKVSKGITDKYIERLAKGVGWARSEYNGPTEEEVEEKLAPYHGSPSAAYRQMIVDTFTNAMGAAGGGGGGSASATAPGDLGKFLWALRDHESGHNYTVVNPISGASGAYQYIDSTWANYGGYTKASQAPPSVQDEKAAKDVAGFFATYKDWGIVASIWLTGHPVGPNGPNADEWNRVPAPGNPTVATYVTSILSRMQSAPT